MLTEHNFFFNCKNCLKNCHGYSNAFIVLLSATYPTEIIIALPTHYNLQRCISCPHNNNTMRII